MAPVGHSVTQTPQRLHTVASTVIVVLMGLLRAAESYGESSSCANNKLVFQRRFTQLYLLSMSPASETPSSATDN